jgi:Tol biopolymer transport system component
VSTSIQLSEISLLPDGSKVIYVSQPTCKGHQALKAPCSIWIAQTDKPGSGRQLFSSSEQPRSPTFRRNGLRIFFLVDIHQPERLVQIYFLDTFRSSKPSLLYGSHKQQPVTLFSISLDGKHLAFTSAEERSERDDANDAKVNDNKGQSERLRLYTFSTCQIRILGIPMIQVISTGLSGRRSVENSFSTPGQGIEPNIASRQCPLTREQ